MKLRTINEGFAMLKEIDPETSFSKNAFRHLVVTGQIPSTRVGTKYLVDMDKLETYLNALAPAEAPPIIGVSAIRPVEG